MASQHRQRVQRPVLLQIWAFPNTAIGLVVGYCGVLFGGQVQKIDGCWEFSGGLVKWLLEKMPTGSGALAMTIGHSILGQTVTALEITRAHEHIHVKQYERWGPLFIPMYFAASGIAWLKGQNPYRDNVFEIEAYSNSTIGGPASASSTQRADDQP